MFHGNVKLCCLWTSIQRSGLPSCWHFFPKSIGMVSLDMACTNTVLRLTVSPTVCLCTLCHSFIIMVWTASIYFGVVASLGCANLGLSSMVILSYLNAKTRHLDLKEQHPSVLPPQANGFPLEWSLSYGDTWSPVWYSFPFFKFTVVDSLRHFLVWVLHKRSGC